MKKQKSLLIAVIGAGLVAVLILIVIYPLFDHRKPFADQTAFTAFAADHTLRDKKPIAAVAHPLCSSGDSGYSSGCTLSSTYFYKLDGDYRTEGKKIFAYLKGQGFDFKPGDKYIEKTNKKLNDKTVANNPSNSEPIIVDLYHKDRKARVRVNLGDKKRTASHTTLSKVVALDQEQLVVVLQFYSP